MALSGTFSKTYRGYTYQITWSAVQSTSGNSSTITCTHKLICASSYGLNISSRSNTCVINGVSKGFTSSAIKTSGGATITLGTTTHTINHDSEGKGSFSLTATFNMQATISGTYVNSIIATGSDVLNTIPRKSSLSFGEFTMGSANTIVINSASSNFTHTITYTFGSKTGSIISKTTNKSVSWTPSINDLASQIPNTTRGQGSLTITTYSGNDSLGSNSYTFYCNLPSSVVPKIGSINLTPQTYSYLIKNLNTVKISALNCTAGVGSNIKSYSFSGPSLSSTTTSASATSGIISSSGTKTYTVTVTDTRGRTASGTASIYCYEYNAPRFKNFKAYRVDANGNPDDNGTRIKCDYDMIFSSVNNTNNVTVKLMHKKTTDSSYQQWNRLSNSTLTSDSATFGLNNPISIDSSYIIYATITDQYGGYSSTNKITIFSAERVLNIRPEGKGIAFGKMADTDGVLDSKWPIKSGGLYVATKPVTLFDSGSGDGSGTITLSENVVGYEYLEIFYADESGHVSSQSIRFCSPNNKTIDLTCIGAQADSGKLYIKTSRYTVINNTITFVRSKWVTLTNGSSANITESTTTNYLKILRVVGFN